MTDADARKALERRKARENLYLSAQRLEYALHGAGEGLWDWDLAAGTVYYAPRFKQILGYFNEEIGEAPEEWTSRIHTEDRTAFDAAMDEHLRGVTSYMSVDIRMRHKDGRLMWIQCTGRVLRDETGTPARLTGTIADITRRKKLEAELQDAREEAENAREALISAVRLILGENVLDPAAATAFEAALNEEEPPPENTPPHLTPRQKEVLALLKDGLSNKQIAHALALKPATAKMHVNAVLKGLNARNRTQAVAHARKTGLL